MGTAHFDILLKRSYRGQLCGGKKMTKCGKYLNKQ